MSTHTAFTGSVPRIYHACLGPLVFEDYAKDLVDRLRPTASDRILELACGTGIVTRQLARAMPQGATLVATDLNDAMLEVARTTVGDDFRVGFQRADACSLPFADHSFDALACQYGVMFFPDKVRAMREAKRVLAPGGRYLFSVWDSLEHNPMSRVAHEIVTALFPNDPPTFLAKVPFGWSDRAEIERTVRAGGFTRFAAQTVRLPSAAPSAADAARALIDGTPLAIALQERAVTDTTPVRQAVARALAERFGDRPCRAPMRAIVVTAS